MQTYISLLRGINVGGHKRIAMEPLKLMFFSLGFQGVSSYIQSGNLVFNYSKSENGFLEKIIAEKIQEQFGIEVPVLVIDLEAWKDITESNPFINNEEMNIETLYLTLLKNSPEPSGLLAMNSSDFAPEEYQLKGQSIYLYIPMGYHQCKLTNNYLEKKLKALSTTRNWKTILAITQLAESIYKP